MNLVISKGPKPSEKVEVPRLVGLTKDQAEAALASVGLKGNASEEANEADEGQVFEQGTEAGKEVEKGTTISYKVSSGPDTTSVPDLTDMTEAQARNALDMAGFGVDVSYQENDSVTEGTVISWNHDYRRHCQEVRQSQRSGQPVRQEHLRRRHRAQQRRVLQHRILRSER